MEYLVVHLDNRNDVDYPIDRFSDLISELDGNTDEEAYVALTHKSEWCLSFSPFGLLIWENNMGELEDTWHLTNVDRDKVVELWTLLSQGNLEEIWKEPWVKGDPLYGT